MSDQWRALDRYSLEPNPLTPPLDWSRAGIAIRMPPVVRLGEASAITGWISLVGVESTRGGVWPHQLSFVASREGFLSSGQAIDEVEPLRASERASNPRRPSDTRRATSYFTFDLRDVLEPLPLGRVYVYAFLGNHVSNVVTVDVVEPEDAADEQDDD